VYTSWTSGTISIKGCKVQKANVHFERLRSIKQQAARNSYSFEATLKRKAGTKKVRSVLATNRTRQLKIS